MSSVQQAVLLVAGAVLVKRRHIHTNEMHGIGRAGSSLYFTSCQPTASMGQGLLNTAGCMGSCLQAALHPRSCKARTAAGAIVCNHLNFNNPACMVGARTAHNACHVPAAFLRQHWGQQCAGPKSNGSHYSFRALVAKNNNDFMRMQ